MPPFTQDLCCLSGGWGDELEDSRPPTETTGSHSTVQNATQKHGRYGSALVSPGSRVLLAAYHRPDWRDRHRWRTPEGFIYTL